MSVVDYAVVALLVLSVGAGVMRGAIREVLNVVGWLLAFGIAHTYAADLAPHFAERGSACSPA